MQFSGPFPNQDDTAGTTGPLPDVYARYGQYIIEKHMLQKLDSDYPIEFPTPEAALPSKSGRPGNQTVGILGGGVGGLYAAMMLESVGVPYEVLEARGRVGGRLFTHKFDNGDFYDYFDVGAMRFPKNLSMKRTFELFESKELNSDGIDIKGKMLKYEL
ncbi:hypothetical protein FRC01_012354, partial [Tulasnella sp. 417]